MLLQGDIRLGAMAEPILVTVVSVSVIDCKTTSKKSKRANFSNLLSLVIAN